MIEGYEEEVWRNLFFAGKICVLNSSWRKRERGDKDIKDYFRINSILIKL